MEVAFKAEYQPAAVGRFAVKLLDHQKELAAFLQKWRDDGKGRELEVKVTVHYQKRTLNQQSLQWELCRRLGRKYGTDPEPVHESVKTIMYPTVLLPNGIYVPKQGKDLTTVEYSQVVEYLIMECAEQQVDISDIWILFTHWRFQQEEDPLEGTYRDAADYRDKHPLCEACGVWLGDGGHLDHIYRRGRDERGPDVDWNWLRLCPGDHAEKHSGGIEAFIARFDHLRAKVERAYERAGGSPPDVDTPADQDEPAGGEPPRTDERAVSGRVEPASPVGAERPAGGDVNEEQTWEIALRVFDGEVVE